MTIRHQLRGSPAGPDSLRPQGTRRGFTLLEALLGLGLLTVLLVSIWNVFGRLFLREGPMSLNTATSRSLVLQQSRLAIRKLFYRVQEGIQILEPLPGMTARHLLFRDVKNRVVQLIHDPVRKKLSTRLFRNGQVVTDVDPSDDLLGIEVNSCESALFTAITPGTVCVSFTTSDDRVKEAYMTVITLSNTRLDR